MNRLSQEKRALAIRLLCEGLSMRATARTVGCSFNTISKLLGDAGKVCGEYLDEVMRDLPCKRLEIDEIWAFVYCKDKALRRGQVKPDHPRAGSIWTWTSVCADTRLMPAWRVGDRSIKTARPFCKDLASRIRGRVQITTDGHKPYMTAMPAAFGDRLDLAMLVKEYGGPQNRYQGSETTVVFGAPKLEKVSTSYAERSNLTMRMSVRRYTRKCNAFSKRIERHCLMVALYFMWYNLLRPHRSLGKTPTTPAMAAGLADHVWTVDELLELIDSRLPPPEKPGPKPGFKKARLPSTTT